MDVERSLTTKDRLVAACGGAVVTSFLMTPLDVIKVRLQAQGVHVSRLTPTTVEYCTHFVYCNGLMDHMCSKRGCPFFDPRAKQHRYHGFFDTLLSVLRLEGMTGLWRGLSPTLLMAVPATALYFTVYEELKLKLESLKRNGCDGSELASTPHQILQYFPAPLLAGASARIFAATVVSPLELIRTQMNSGEKGGVVVSNLRKGSFWALWRGLTPTLFRDVPFSALYWTMYERLQQYMLARRRLACEQQLLPLPTKTSLVETFLCGTVAGMCAAALTTPYDVAKTRMQINLYSEPPFYNEKKTHTSTRGTLPPASSSLSTSMMQELLLVWRESGWKGLTAGIGARVARIAPSCAIMITSFEMGKRYLAS